MIVGMGLASFAVGAPTQDRLVRGTLKGGAHRFVAVRATESARAAALQHGLADSAAAVLAEAFVATALLGTPLKRADEKYSLALRGDGALRSLHTDINHMGDIRGYLRIEGGGAALTADDLMSPPGSVWVTRSLPGQVVYQAVTEMRLGSIASDLALHTSTSDQIETEIRIYNEGRGADAVVGGLLVQVLPGADIEDMVGIREALLHGEHASPDRDLIERPERLAQMLLAPFSPQILEVSQLQLRCTCTRERVETIFRQLEVAHLKELILPDGSAFADCHWCGTSYRFSSDEMNGFLLRVDDKASSH
jgi:molecular chaperone Hsp33